MKKPFKGIYKPTNPKKYVGNPNNIVYRSLLERRFIVYCDTNPGIVQWASEELPIRYYNPIDKKYHRYFVDFIIKTDKNKKMLIEIKPSRQITRPKPPKKKTRSYMRESFEFIKNQAKWKAATAYAEDNNAVFKIITEKELGVKF